MDGALPALGSSALAVKRRAPWTVSHPGRSGQPSPELLSDENKTIAGGGKWPEPAIRATKVTGLYRTDSADLESLHILTGIARLSASRCEFLPVNSHRPDLFPCEPVCLQWMSQKFAEASPRVFVSPGFNSYLLATRFSARIAVARWGHPLILPFAQNRAWPREIHHHR